MPSYKANIVKSKYKCIRYQKHIIQLHQQHRFSALPGILTKVTLIFVFSIIGKQSFTLNNMNDENYLYHLTLKIELTNSPIFTKTFKWLCTLQLREAVRLIEFPYICVNV